MEKCFQIGQSNEIVKNGKVYDLHNAYEILGISINFGNRQLRISFLPDAEYGKGEQRISLCFEGIDYLEFSPNFGAQAITGLDEMGYKAPDDLDDNWLLDEKQATADDHMYFRLDCGAYVRVHSQKANIVEEPKLIQISQ